MHTITLQDIRKHRLTDNTIIRNQGLGKVFLKSD